MKVFVVFGTRPEAIKMAPVIQALRTNFDADVKICVTGQHRKMLDQVLDLFKIVPDYDLNLMRENQSLSQFTAITLPAIENILVSEKPDFVLVQGDTGTTFSAALAAFYQKIPVGHIEAGLRSNDIYSPWPEEINRKLTGCIAELHFAATDWAANNLREENVPKHKIFVTGNPVIDSLLQAKKYINDNEEIKRNLMQKFSYLNSNKKLILVTGHRRESFGKGFQEICNALKKLSQRDDVEIVYPVHLNPNVQNIVKQVLGEAENVFLIEPQDYFSFIYLMQCAYLILTDSGGIQEEAPTFGKPVLVMRDVTERPEAVIANISKIVGTDAARIVTEAEYFLNNIVAYQAVQKVENPYGDGTAAMKIAQCISGYPHKENFRFPTFGKSISLNVH